jgi:c(7)-type cytochrome triheme protein
VAGLVVIAFVAACTSANPVMTALFEGVPRPGEAYQAPPVVKQPRRPPYVKPPPRVKFVEVPDIPAPIDWKARYEALAKGDDGEVAWMKALETKQIEPRAGIKPEDKDDDPTDMDVELATSGQPEWKAVFPHKAHTSWLKCDNCHGTGLFEMEKGKARITMANIGAGEQCGACHGKVAFGLATCAACHPAAPK